MLKVNDIKWRLYQGVLIPDEPPDKEIKITTQQIKYLLKTSGAYFIRWISNFDCQNKTEFWYVIKDSSSQLDSLSQNTRHNVRRGLKRCIIEKIPAEIVAKEGYESYIQAFNKYETFIKPETKEEFEYNILSKTKNPRWEFWGIWNSDKKMIGYSINEIFEDSCSYATTKFHPHYLKLYPSDSLFFTMNSYYINDRKMKYINDGPRSLSHKTNIQDYFINKFDFRRAYCRIHIYYSPKIKVLVNLFYPFSKIIRLINLNLTNKLDVLLKHEEIRRSFD